MADVDVGRKEPLANGYAHAVRVNGESYRVEMERHEGVRDFARSRGTVSWTARVVRASDGLTVYNRRVLASTKVAGVLRMAGLIPFGEVAHV